MRSRHLTALTATLVLAGTLVASAFTAQPVRGQDTTAAAAGLVVERIRSSLTAAEPSCT